MLLAKKTPQHTEAAKRVAARIKLLQGSAAPAKATAPASATSAALASPLGVDLMESYDYMQSQREGLVEVMTKHLPNPMPPADASRMMVRRRRLEVDRGQWH